MRGRLLLLTASAALAAATTALAGPNDTASSRWAIVKPTVVRGEQGHLVAYVDTTQPCRITVFRRHPYVRMRPKRVDRWGLGLYPKRADTDDGRVAWAWIVGTKTPLGRWWVHLSCAPAVSLRTSFRVVS